MSDTLTTCGPLCDRKHFVDEPHNRNLAPTEPADHRPKANKQAAEASDEPHTFTWDGDEWTIRPSDATRMDFLAHLTDAEDLESEGDGAGASMAMVRAVWALLGKDQGNRLLKGRQPEAIGEFFEAMGDAVGSGNR